MSGRFSARAWNILWKNEISRIPSAWNAAFFVMLTYVLCYVYDMWNLILRRPHCLLRKSPQEALPEHPWVLALVPPSVPLSELQWVQGSALPWARRWVPLSVLRSAFPSAPRWVLPSVHPWVPRSVSHQALRQEPGWASRSALPWVPLSVLLSEWKLARPWGPGWGKARERLSARAWVSGCPWDS